jgi:ABC-type transport system involved in multi-copper enzyme maturation permease subunit
MATYGELFNAIYVAYPILFMFVGWRAIRGGDGVAYAILIGVVAYTIYSSWTVSGECRRNLVFYPLLFYFLRHWSIARSDTAIDGQSGLIATAIPSATTPI